MARTRPTEMATPSTRSRLGRGGTTLLLATVFVSGAAVMIVEMTAVRAVQPFFGSTTYVWTNVIAVVLAALAVGYAIGGRLADRRPSPRLLYGLLGTGGLLVALAALLVTPVSRLFLDDGVNLEGVVSVLMWGSLGTALVIFAPPILLLGAVGPIAIRLLAHRGVGRAAGSVFALSTVGSILGTYLPTLVLVPHLGSRGSILVAAGVLLVASAVGFVVFGRRRAGSLTLAAILVGATVFAAAHAGHAAPGRPGPILDGGVSTVLEETESPYQYLTVRDDTWPEGSRRVLTINEGLYTFHALDVSGRVLTGSRYYDAYTVLPLLLDLEPGATMRAFVVGMACGINATQWHHFYANLYDVRIDGAELDPTVIELGRRYFDMPGPEVPWFRVHALDGRSMLEYLPEETRYHILVLDAFANELYVPFHLATREFFELCARRLEDGGILAINVYARGDHAPNLAAIENTLASVFGSALRVPHYESGGYLLLAARGGAPLDLSRLSLDAVRGRLAKWDGLEAWTRTTEWPDLMVLADGIRESAAARGRVVSPRRGHAVLTDDDAPLEWLTDRFLWDAEAGLFETGDAQSLALAGLRSKQTNRLLLVACGWVAVLLGLGVLGRRLGTGSQGCD